MADRRHPMTLFWGLVFALCSAAAAWRATGHPIDTHPLLAGSPLVLIALGVLVALSGRRRH